MHHDDLSSLARQALQDAGEAACESDSLISVLGDPHCLGGADSAVHWESRLKTHFDREYPVGWPRISPRLKTVSLM